MALLREAGYSARPATPRLPSELRDVALIVVASTSAPSGAADPRSLLPLVAVARRQHPTAFIVAWHPAAETDAFFREDAFFDGRKGCNMASFDLGALVTAARRVLSAGGGTGGGTLGRLLQCPWCGLRGFTEDALWRHAPLFHVNSANHAEVVGRVTGVVMGFEKEKKKSARTPPPPLLNAFACRWRAPCAA